MTDARFFETLEDAAGLRFDREDGLAEWSKVERCEEGSGKMDKLHSCAIPYLKNQALKVSFVTVNREIIIF